MPKRVRLLTDVYMPIDGPNSTVLVAGSVIDIPDSLNLSASSAEVLSPGEAAGSLKAHGLPTPVRTVRKK